VENARDVREEDDPLRVESDGERRRRLVGVHVQRAKGERCDDRDPAGSQRVEDGLGAARLGHSDVPELRHAGRAESDLVPGETDRAIPQQPADLAIDIEQRPAHDLERGPIGDAPAADERDGQACACHRGRDLRAAAVDDDCIVELAELRGAGDRPSDLEDDHVVYSALIRTYS
jgi:hypothetical protein